jgi:glycosyltransferase involved in cell wall biosynthesis
MTPPDNGVSRPMNLLLLVEGDAELISAAGSGSAHAVLDGLRQQGHTVGSGDVDLAGIERGLGAALTFSPDRKRWSVKYHLGAIPFRLRSRNAESHTRRRGPSLDAILQYGATFSPRATGVPYFLYCDSNVHISRDDPHAWAAQLSPSEVNAAIAREQTVYDGAAGIFTFSERVRRSFVGDLRIPADRVETVFAGPNFDPSAIPALRAHPAEKPNILFVGREFERKGGDVLLKAFERVRAEVPDATLTIIGPRDLSLSIPGVEVLGFLRKDDPAEYKRLLDAYAQATAFAFPTRFEPFGVVLLEAMFFGLPCVATNVWAIPEIVLDGETGYIVELDDASSLGNRLVELLKNPQKAHEMGRVGRLRAETHFTWQAVTAKMAARISQTLRSRSAE